MPTTHGIVGSLLLVCAFFTSVGTEPARGTGRDDLLSLVRVRHRAAREAIHTLSADVSINYAYPRKSLWISGNYWRSFNMVRIREFPPGKNEIEDHLLKDGELRGVGRRILGNGKYDSHGTGRDPASSLIGFCDVWKEMLIEFSDHNATRHDYDSFLGLANNTPKVSREKMNGIDCVRVSISFPADSIVWSYVFWHDIERNYLIRKATLNADNGSTISEWEIEEFQEPKPGIYVPVRCRLKVNHKGALDQELVTTLTNVKVNEPIAKDVFTLPSIPRGTFLHDRIEGTRYPIDSSWKPIGPKTDNPVITIQSRSGGAATPFFAQTEVEPKPWSRWLLPASIAILVTAVGIWYYRKRQAAKEATAAS